MTAVDFAGFVDRLAHVSGEVITPFFRTHIGADDKSSSGTFDPVTEADRSAETAMRRLIAQTFPSHGIVGEEYGVERGDAEYVWVLDPIDGTKSFISGFPTWGTLIGLLHRGVPVYGMMAQPFTRERFSGDGRRSQLRRPAQWRAEREEWSARTLHTRPCGGLGEATLMTTHPALIEAGPARDAFHRMESRVRLSRYGGDCYSYCMLAAGFVDLVVESGLKPYDIVALIPIIEGAGGIVTSWDGGSAAQGGRVLAAGDRRVHEAALEALKSSDL